jgi:hypothetical protein
MDSNLGWADHSGHQLRYPGDAVLVIALLLDRDRDAPISAVTVARGMQSRVT